MPKLRILSAYGIFLTLSLVARIDAARAQVPGVDAIDRAAHLGLPMVAEPREWDAAGYRDGTRPHSESMTYFHDVARSYDELPPPQEDLPLPRYERLARMEREHPKPFTIDMVFIGRSGVEDPATNVKMFDVGMMYQFRIPLFDRFLFTIRPMGDVLFLSGPGGTAPVLPEQLYKTAFDFQFDFRINDTWGISLGATPGLWTDFIVVDGSSFRLPARALATYRFSDTLFIAGGLYYTDNFYRNLWPAIGVIWDVYPKTRLELVFPRGRAIYNITDQWNVYGVFERGGDTYSIRTELPTGFTNEKFQYRDYRFMLGTEVTAWERVAMLVELGVAFDRLFRFEYQSQWDINAGFLVRAGVRF